MSEPGKMQEIHYRFLGVARELSDPRQAGELLTMDEVCERIGVEDREQCTLITVDLLEGGYITQDPGTNEVGMFRISAKGRVAAARRR